MPESATLLYNNILNVFQSISESKFRLFNFFIKELAQSGYLQRYYI